MELDAFVYKLDIYDNLDRVFAYLLSAYRRGEMKRTLAAVLFMVTLNSSANAELLNIGTATYSGSEYDLIYDTDDELTWLDYSRPGTDYYSGSVAWAASLNNPGVLDVNLDSGYTALWGSNQWRLPEVTGYQHFSGPVLETSEIQDLYYDELGNIANDPSINISPFENIVQAYYWSEPTWDMGPTYRPAFNFSNGQLTYTTVSVNGGIYAMAVISGSVVPEPATLGLLGLVSGGIYFTRRFFIA
jgi:hypothetical protein